MKTMTLDEVKNLPPLTKEEIEEIKQFKNTDFSDCPVQTPEQLAQFRRWNDLDPAFYKPRKTDVHIRIDSDVLEWFKSQGKGYQSRINAVLRSYVVKHCAIE